MTISMSIVGVENVEGKLGRFVKYAQQDAAEITDDYGHKFMQQVVLNASGRPGPEIVTGAYVRSINIVTEDQYTVGAETYAVQAMRLEKGYVGIDAMGRHYAQPPFPHWQPAVDEIAPKYKEAMQSAVRRWWR